MHDIIIKYDELKVIFIEILKKCFFTKGSNNIWINFNFEKKKNIIYIWENNFNFEICSHT